MTAIAPPKVAGRVKDFCERVSPGQTPVHLPITPPHWATRANCFPNVGKHVEEHGGALAIGWAIWVHPGIFIEAEFHGVWKDLAGQLHDLTPRAKGGHQILFLPDPGKTYDGQQVNNIREPLCDAPELPKLFAALKAEFEFMNRGRFANFHGDLNEIMTAEEKVELGAIRARKREAQLAYTARFEPQQFARTKLDRNGPCPCGSGRKYKQCHGR